MQGGMNAVRMPDESLARATGSAGNDVYRGDRLPKDLLGDYFYGEVVARIVRRLRPVKTEGLTQLQNVYPFAEFIRSTTRCSARSTSRPRPTARCHHRHVSGHHPGIAVVGSRHVSAAAHRPVRLARSSSTGRIWRLTYEGMGRRTEQPKMLSETPAQLVAHLSDANGWWRDTAQQLLVGTSRSCHR